MILEGVAQKKIYSHIISTCILFFYGASLQAMQIHSVNLGTFRTQEQADSYCMTFGGKMKISPFVLRREDPIAPFVVLYGYYPFRSDAWAVSQTMQSNQKLSVYSWDWDGRPIAKTDFTEFYKLSDISQASSQGILDFWEKFVPEVAKKTTVEHANQLPEPSADLSEEQLIIEGYRSSDSKKAVRALSYYLDKTSDQSIAQKAMVQLVRKQINLKQWDDAQVSMLMLLSQKPDQETQSAVDLLDAYQRYHSGPVTDALPAFTQCATNPKNDPTVRLDALRMAAGCAHKMRDYPQAILAFRALESSSAPASVRHEASMQLAGIMFELVSRGIGTWQETRDKLQAVINDTVNGTPQNIATAKLMYAETYFNEGDYFRAADEAQSVADQTVSHPREHITALFWVARSRQQLGQCDEASAAFEKVLEAHKTSKADAKTYFPGLQADVLAMRARISIFSRLGAIQNANRDSERLLKEYPDSKEAADIQNK